MISSCRRPHCSSRGFTLIELLAVVIITGILSMLAVVGFRGHMASSRSTEAVAVIKAIRAAEETYMAENQVYLDVSTSSGGLNWYPRLTPDSKRVGFGASNQVAASRHSHAVRWRKLAPLVQQGVMFSYLVNAGAPGTIMRPLQMAKAPDFTTPQALDWYVIQARGNVDDDIVFSHYATTSVTGEIYAENDGE